METRRCCPTDCGFTLASPVDAGQCSGPHSFESSDVQAGLIEPMFSSGEANPLALCTARKQSSDIPHALKIPGPKGRNLH